MGRRILSFYLGYETDIYILFFSKVINAAGTFVLPFLSLYITKNFNSNEAEAGVIITLASLVSLLGAYIGGKLSDKYNNKKLIVIGQLVSAFCLCCVVFVSPPIIKLILIIVSFMVGAAVLPVMDAFVAKKISEADRKNVYSFMYLGLNIGYAVGTVLAGLLFNFNNDLIFVGNAFTAFVSAILILIFIKYSPEIKSKNEVLDDSNKDQSYFTKVLIKDYKFLFLILTLFYAFCYGQNNFALPLDITNKIGFDGPKYYGFLMSCNGMCAVALTPLISKLTRNLKAGTCICLAGLLYAFGFGGYYFSYNFISFFTFTILWTLGEILYSINYTVYLIENVDEYYIGRTISKGYIVTKLGIYINPLIIGKYSNYFEISSTWILIFAIMIIVTIVMNFINLKTHSRFSERFSNEKIST